MKLNESKSFNHLFHSFATEVCANWLDLPDYLTSLGIQNSPSNLLQIGLYNNFNELSRVGTKGRRREGREEIVYNIPRYKTLPFPPPRRATARPWNEAF